MKDTSQKQKDGLVACEICMKEIPVSEAKSEEATDYVAHYCGLECYAIWKAQQHKDNQ
ncbi:MAG: DUF3330 domain-containing protein [Gammaproteobacteria bacterium]|jgi:hypothetical protein|nr:DUF3330 domain-containing protein [Gammaproteobacteria bacterium]